MSFGVIFIGVAMAVALVLLADGPARRGRKRGKWLRASLILLIGALAAYACLVALREEEGIGSRGKTVNATVDDMRTIRRKGTVHQAKYRFQLNSNGPVYSARDDLRRANAWADIDSKTAMDARTNRVLPVLYDTADPWNNIPVRPSHHRLLLPNMSWLCFGGVIVLFSGIFLVIVVFDLKLAK